VLRNDHVVKTLVPFLIALAGDPRLTRPRPRQKLLAWADAILLRDTKAAADTEMLLYVEEGLRLAISQRRGKPGDPEFGAGGPRPRVTIAPPASRPATAPPHPGFCVRCGKPLTPRQGMKYRTDKKYCSHTCQQATFRATKTAGPAKALPPAPPPKPAPQEAPGAVDVPRSELEDAARNAPGTQDVGLRHYDWHHGRDDRQP
jgi:hypothetical protein